jgi:hypothetical protein
MTPLIPSLDTANNWLRHVFTHLMVYGSHHKICTINKLHDIIAQRHNFSKHLHDPRDKTREELPITMGYTSTQNGVSCKNDLNQDNRSTAVSNTTILTLDDGHIGRNK